VCSRRKAVRRRFVAEKKVFEALGISATPD
jgi:hypothetical protein